VFTVGTLLDLSDFDDTEMVVQVEGQQWWWQFTYDTNGNDVWGDEGDIVTANELVIPADTNVELVITSNDVIHSFWIPELNGTRDAVPGLRTNWKLQADEPGRYRGTCKEFCGLSHARMQMYVIALAENEYAAWQEHQLEPAAELTEADFESASEFADYEAGAALFESQCATCHTVRTEGGVIGPEGGRAAQVSGEAPDLTHLMSREWFAGSILGLYIGVQDDLHGETSIETYLTKEGMEPDVNNLENWLRDPSGQKPMDPDPDTPNPHGDDPEFVGRGMPTLGLSEEQIDQLIAYLTSLK
jgi:cytochrome c oxidase subunit 2